MIGRSPHREPAFRVDPDAARARTPNGSLYGAETHERIVEEVLPATWQLAPFDRGVPAPGHVQPWRWLEGSVDEPLLLSRDERGRLRALSNVCTHRGKLLVEHAGPVERLRCGYHGRCFDLAGRLTAAPGFDRGEDFPTERDDLPRAECAEWLGFAFASLRPATAFERWSTFLTERLGWLALPAVAAWTHDYEVEANWALYVENYLEGFHVPFAHEGLAAHLDWPRYRVEPFEHGVLQVGIAKEGERGLPLPAHHPDAGSAVAGYYVWLFPTTMLNVYPWGLSVNLVEPLGPTRTRVRYRQYLAEPALRGRGAGADLERVELEDQALVASCQRGVRARLFSGGRYSPRHERGVHHFHRLLAAALGGPRPDSGVIDL